MSTGQLQSLQQSASQYAGMVTAFCDKLRLDFILFQKLFFFRYLRRIRFRDIVILEDYPEILSSPQSKNIKMV